MKITFGIYLLLIAVVVSVVKSFPLTHHVVRIFPRSTLSSRLHLNFGGHNFGSTSTRENDSDERKKVQQHPFGTTKVTKQVTEFATDDAATQQKEQEQIQYDLKRHCNRAALTEAILREKLQDLSLTQNKLKVLQDVVQKLKSKYEVSRKEMQAKYDTVSTQNQDLKTQYEKLRNEWESERKKLMVQIQQYEQVNKDAKAALEKERDEWQQQQKVLLVKQNKVSEQEHDLNKQQQEAQSKLSAMKAKLFEKSELLKQLRNQLSDLNEQLGTKEEQLLEKEEELKISRKRGGSSSVETTLMLEKIQEKYKDALREQDGLQKQIDRLEHKLEHEKRTKRDAIAIAESSVKASERREQKSKDEIVKLQNQVEEYENKNKQLMDELSNIQKRFPDLQQHQDEQKLEDRDDVESVEVMQQQQVKLEDEIMTLKEQMRALKLTHSAQLCSEKKRYSEELDDIEQDYEEHIRQLRLQLSSSSSSSNQARRGGIWQRIRKRFRRT